MSYGSADAQPENLLQTFPAKSIEVSTLFDFHSNSPDTLILRLSLLHIGSPRSSRLGRQLARSHDIARIAHVHRLSILGLIRLRLHVHHRQVVHAFGYLIARGRIAIAEHRPEDLVDALGTVRLLRTAVVGREVKAHGAHVGRGSGRPDPRTVLDVWGGKFGTDGGDGFVGAGVEGEMGVGVVGEALDTVRSRGCRLYDGGVAGIAGRIG